MPPFGVFTFALLATLGRPVIIDSPAPARADEDAVPSRDFQ
ncbi:hypothetical protein [Frigidibacter albus]|nr:hypothetical protein [Frigidibacter albus]